MHGYHVRLQVFEGPLDLLLHLIEKRELDITAISLAAVADQFIEYISEAEPDLDALADFLVVAAKLLVLKSLALFPQPISNPEPEQIAADLTQRLIEYRAFRRVAEHLRVLEEAGHRSHPRTVPPRPIPTSGLPEGLTLNDLVQALQRAISRIPAQPTDIVIPRPTFSVVDKARMILAYTNHSQRVSLHRLLSQASCRAEAIATFLAVLELLKARQIEVQQERLFDDIVLLARPDNGHESQHDASGIDEYVGYLGMTVGSETLVDLVEASVAD